MKYKIGENEKKTLIWWYNRKNKIDFDPPYQRQGGLWSDFDKAYLIDSIINGFDVPKLYLADFTWKNVPGLNKNSLMYAIIDGKQRLETIFSFIDNNLALNDDFIYYQDLNVKAGGMKYKDLSDKYPELAENFREFNLSVVTVVAETEDTITELFVRLNRSKPLTGAEIRNAMKGDVPKLIRSIAEHEFFKQYVSFSNNRGEDKNAAAKILLFEYSGAFKDTKRKSLDNFAQSNNYNKIKMQLTYRNVMDNLSILTTIFLPKDSLLKTSGTIPLLYKFIMSKEENEFSLIRAFLVFFERKRKESNANEKDFLDYNIHNRSTNDENSFIKRMEFLNRQFEKWVHDR
jgi:hypothetical protein